MAAFDTGASLSRVFDVSTSLLRTVMVPHANDETAVVVRPFWWRSQPYEHGALAGKIGSHGPHHCFGDLGRVPHVQVNVWRIGVKGSGRYLRVPLVAPPGVRRHLQRTA